MVKLSKVAVWFVPPENAIALPADVIVPPPVARIDAPLPCSPTAAARGVGRLDVERPGRGDRARRPASRGVAGEEAVRAGAGGRDRRRAER